MAKKNLDHTFPAGVPEKPLVFANSYFDDPRMDALEYAAREWDAAYVPGYSELKTENQIRESKGLPRIEAPRLQWVRITRTGGGDVSGGDAQLVSYMGLGYRACGVADLKENGWGMPPAGWVGPDGTIRRDDQALFIVGEKRAARNREKDRRAREEKTSPKLAGDVVERLPEKETSVRGTLRELANLEVDT